MKAKNLFLLAIATMFFASCEDSDFDKKSNVLERSRQQWEELKKTNGDSYMYKTDYTSWVGTHSETSITVENGKVTGKHYVYWQELITSSIEMKADTAITFTETSANLGTHEEGSEPITLDEVYDKAKEYLNIDTKTNKLYFETFQNGILKTCGYVPDNCADDCFNGIRIDTVVWRK